MIRLELFSYQQEDQFTDLIELLQDSAESGASVGFMPPLEPEEATAYWLDVLATVADGSKLLIVALNQENRVVGSVQLHLEQRPNGAHRAEVSKLMVHQKARRQGVAKQLMLELENRAYALNRTTLVLDTRAGDPSNDLFDSLGYQLAGSIPQYAKSHDGQLHATHIYYKLLSISS